MTPETLSLLIERASEKTGLAQRRVAQLIALVEQARANFTLLQQYAGEYASQAATRAGQRRDTAARENQIVFLDRLDDALATQENELALRQKAVDVAQHHLVICLKQQKSLETLKERINAANRLRENRLDQKRTDEFAQRQHQRATARDDVQHGDAP